MIDTPLTNAAALTHTITAEFARTLERERDQYKAALLRLHQKTKAPSDPCSGECKALGRCPHDPVCNA